MSLSLEMITVDCADPHRLAAWWADAVAGKGQALGRGRVPLGGPGRDPDGNAFCVAAPRP